MGIVSEVIGELENFHITKEALEVKMLIHNVFHSYHELYKLKFNVLYENIQGRP